VFGSARDLQRDQLGTYERAMRAHGDLARFRIGPPRLGFEFDAIFDPDGARHVLTETSAGYVKDAPVFREFKHLFGEGLFTFDGEPWRRRRRTLQPLFTKRRVRDYIPLMSSHAEELVSTLRDPEKNVRLPAATTEYTLNVLGSALFGADMASVAPVIEHAVPLLNAHGARRGLAPLRLPASLPTPASRRARRAQKDLRAFVERLMSARHGAEQPEDLLGRLMTATDPETGVGLDVEAIRDEAMIFLGAGLDPPPTALACTLYLLGGNQDVQERVRQEVQQTLGDRPVTADDLPALQYTAQVVDEALRLYPPGHTLLRRSTVTDDLHGYPIPPGRIVAVSIWGIHRNSKVWTDPHEFRPDRFSAARAAERDTYAYLPFGRGPRTCIGVHLAHAEFVVAVATVVRKLRITAPDRQPPVKAGLTLMTDEPFDCRFEPLAA
jgi:cytochrome P450